MRWNNKDTQVFEVLSLFSGGGFLDIGFLNKGFQIKEALEINQYFIQAYNHGLKSYAKKTENPFFRNNLVTSHEVTAPGDASCPKMHQRLKNDHCRITGIIGGPPCQDYSVGGQNAGIEGKKGRLIYSYLKIVSKVKPTFIFFENVSGLYTTKRHRIGFLKYVEEIKKSGYEVWYTVLNALEYGVPQDRPRLVLVGFRKEFVGRLIGKGYSLEKDNEKLKMERGDQCIFRWPSALYPNPKGQHWPSRNYFEKKRLSSKLCEKLGEFKHLRVCEAFHGLNKSSPNQKEHFQPKSSKFKEVEEGDTNRKSFKRLHRNRYSPTVAYGNNEVHLHPTKPRRLTVREALRLQSVPDEYELPTEMPLSPKFKLISNGVATGMAEVIAEEIRRTLLLDYE